MGEYFKIVDVNGQELYEIPMGGAKLIEFFWSLAVGHLLDLFIVSPTALAGWDKDEWPIEEFPVHRAAPHASKLLGLANELLAEIFKWITSVHDAINLCLVDGALSAVGAPRLRELLDAELAPWTGHRLVCFGDYVRDAGFPPFLADIVAGLKAAAGFEGSFYRLASKYKKQTFSQEGRWHQVLAGLEKHAGAAGLSGADRRVFDALLAHLTDCAKRASRAEIDASVVLCNLTRHTYVRGAAVREKYKRGHPSLGHLLLAHVCWSDDGDFHFKDARYNVTRGPWTGHRFEVTTMGRLRPGIEWEDGTSAALERLNDLWRATDH
ncbi:hypothetical protein PsYK624_064250 [Phanerochaete sordida]|uniref:Uncharacterized protein n=1 Tax=Phanerochaete sordida TaxID=48140 RepID=A0A9P3LCA1_9APHY|nr:hypothetical protein PsYK624_064250 [Phanerochaete sordida]